MDGKADRGAKTLHQDPDRGSIQPDQLFGPEDDQFRFLTKIGHGGQGKVYLCERLSSGHKYAAKIISISSAVTARTKSLQREIQIMTELEHPSIVNLLCSYDDPHMSPNPTQRILVMDYCKGGDLWELLRKEINITGKEAFRGLGGNEAGPKYLARQLVEGMGYMHAKGILHRDLKLENILVYRSFPCPAELRSSAQVDFPEILHEVKICDFGYSRHSTESGHNLLSRTKSVLGTPSYVAPEVLTREYDSRADYWGFGIIMYAILCGDLPFSVRNTDMILERYLDIVSHIDTNIPSWNALSDDAKSFVQGLLTVDVEKRLAHHSCLSHSWVKSVPFNVEHGTPLEGAVFSPPVRNDAQVGVVRRICGRAGDALDSVNFDFRDGSVESYGGGGGTHYYEASLKPDEMILAVLQETRKDYLGTALVFFTSEGRTINISGSEHKNHRIFVAPADCQIAGLQFDGSKLQGIHIADAPEKGSDSMVSSISGRTGYAVDAVRLHMKNGKTRAYGTADGNERGPWNLKSDEYIFAVEQGYRDAYLGNSIVFYTSAGNVHKLLGMQNRHCIRFAAPVGSQICRLHFEGSRLATVHLCSADGDMLQASDWTRKPSK